MTDGELVTEFDCAMTLAVPGVTVVTKPAPSTVATLVLSDDQVKVAVNGFPSWSRAWACSCWVEPADTVAVCGVTLMVVRTCSGVGAGVSGGAGVSAPVFRWCP